MAVITDILLKSESFGPSPSLEPTTIGIPVTKRAEKKQKQEPKQHPLHAIEDALSKVDRKDERQKVVIIATGAYNPVHRDHFVTFQMAKHYLVNHCNINVLCGFMSPSHDLYVQSKQLDFAFPATDRSEMCKLAIRENEELQWIHLDEWEHTQDHYIPFDGVITNLNDAVQARFPNENIKTFYLCGADVITRVDGKFDPKGLGVVTVGRPPYSDQLRKLVKEDKIKFELYFANDENCGISSTAIRERITNRQQVLDLTYPCVQNYLNALIASSE